MLMWCATGKDSNHIVMNGDSFSAYSVFKSRSSRLDQCPEVFFQEKSCGVAITFVVGDALGDGVLRRFWEDRASTLTD